jgi:tetratricopeptide (TPR) repeat protein
MIPTLLCSKCNSSIAWEDRYCTSCGEPVELPSAISSVIEARQSRLCHRCGERNPAEADSCRACGAPLGEPGRKKEKTSAANLERRGNRPLSSGKLIAGLALFLIGGLVVLELISGKREFPQQVPHQHEEPAANLQALPQIEELEKKVAAKPDDPPLLLQLANTLHDNRFYEKAITYYTKYLRLNPKDADARVDLGICYNDSGNKEEAVRQMKEAIKNNPKHVLAHFNLGIIHLQAREVEEATTWFKKTIELAPGSEAAERARRLIAQHAAPSQTTTN